MSCTDTSSSARLRQIKAQTLAVYHNINPTANEAGRLRSLDSSLHTTRVSGGYPVVRMVERKPATVEAGCCACENVTAPSVSATYVSENSGVWTYTISWAPIPDATSYTFSSNWSNATFSNITNSSATMTFTWPDGDNTDNPTVTVTAVNSCSSAASTPVPTNPCFLAGSIVAMADGSSKAIEDVSVGDAVLGAFGEINRVLALHRPFLGNASMIRINNEHSSTSHHPHISVDKKFYCDDISAVENGTYGKEHNVIDASGNVVKRHLHGLNPGRVEKYVLGITLQTSRGGKLLESLTSYSLPSDTQLYNLVVDGSHTYCVDGYAVTGWPREDDFDYDTWGAK
jgi:hypothetical protein